MRDDVGNVLATQPPYDLAAATDAVLIHTREPISSKQHRCLRIHVATVRLTLNHNAHAALADHGEARRHAWQRVEALNEQTISLQGLLSRRGTGLAWLLRHYPQLAIDPQATGDNTDRVIALLDRIKNESQQPAEDPIVEPLVELFRDFIAPLTDPTQRQLVLRMLPQFFALYNRHDLAQQAEARAAEHPAANTAGPQKAVATITPHQPRAVRTRHKIGIPTRTRTRTRDEETWSSLTFVVRLLTGSCCRVKRPWSGGEFMMYT